MLKQQVRLFTKIAVILDLVSISLALVLAYQLVQLWGDRLESFSYYTWLLLIIIPVWLFLLSYSDMYASMRTKKFTKIVANLTKVHVVGGIIVTSAIYMFDPHGVSRLLAGAFIFLSLLFLIVTKVTIKLVLSYFRRKGLNVRFILIVGNEEKARHFIELIKRHAAWGLIIAGFVTFCDEEDSESVPGCIKLGTINDLIDICKNSLIDEVVFSLKPEQLTAIDDHCAALHEMGITVRMVLDLYDFSTVRKEVTMFHGDIPMLTFYGKAFDAGQLFIKRCLDIVGAMVGLCITGFLCPFIALAIRIESKGPFFFVQERVGVNGRPFECWKFRSMFVDAESRKQELMAHNEMQGAMFKIKDDPRITRVGKFLRSTSLDELPQFWNVLHGEMSLVGTRPPTPDEVATYENWHRKRICIKPGMTGLWQVSGRNQIYDFDEVVRLDIRYIEEWSLWLDIQLLFKTVWVVLAKKGSS